MKVCLSINIHVKISQLRNQVKLFLKVFMHFEEIFDEQNLVRESEHQFESCFL